MDKTWRSRVLNKARGPVDLGFMPTGASEEFDSLCGEVIHGELTLKRRKVTRKSKHQVHLPHNAIA